MFFLDAGFRVLKHLKDATNDLDGFPLVFPWTTTDTHLVFLKNSVDFYNEYVETFKGTKVQVTPGSIHEFFQKNREKLMDEKLVLIMAKYK